MDLDLAGRTALVTGGSQGIGAAVARLLGREGAQVVITYHSQRERADAVVADIKAGGGSALAVPMELAELGSVREAVAAAGPVDILVNNAVQWGADTPWTAPMFEEMPLAEWQRTFRNNTEPHLVAIQAVVPHMRERGWGRIVNVSSGVALDGVPGTAPYAAAKAALHGLTATLVKELAPDGILVNVVMPGPTMTERAAARITPEARRVREQATPGGRLLGPEDVAPVIGFLCSPLNTAVTGEYIRASGGHRS